MTVDTKMDFSKYTPPSKQWLALTSSNPSLAKEGFTNNDPIAASAFRNDTNTLRAALVASHFARTSINNRVTFKTHHIPTRDSQTIPLRHVVPAGYAGRSPLRALVYFHGGGMLFGTEESDDHVCAEIAAALNVAVLNVVYRHTPEWRFPTQLEDAVDGFEWIIKNAKELHIDVEGLAVFGCSAGALPATAVVQHDLALARSEGRRTLFSGVVLTIPWLVHAEKYPDGIFVPGKSSREECVNVPVLPKERMKFFVDLFGAPNPDDPLLNPALLPDEAFEGWPKTGILVAGSDPLRDDGLYFATRLEKLGIRTSVHIFPGQPHGFRKWTEMPAAITFDDRTVDCVSWALGLNCQKMSGWHEYQD